MGRALNTRSLWYWGFTYRHQEVPCSVPRELEASLISGGFSLAVQNSCREGGKQLKNWSRDKLCLVMDYRKHALSECHECHEAMIIKS